MAPEINTLIASMLAMPRVLLLRVLLFACLIATGAALVSHSKFGELLQNTLEQKINFSVRSLVGRDPQLSDKIKIYAFDDQTAGVLQKHDLRLRDWQVIFAKIAERKPRSIFVDKVWSLPIGDNFDLPVDTREGAKFVAALEALDVPIAVGGSVFMKEIARRTPVDLNAPDYDPATILHAQDRHNGERQVLPAWMPNTDGVLYGPHAAIVRAFTHVGQLDNAGLGHVFPFISVNRKSVVPHAAILAANVPFEITDDKLIIDGHRVGIDRNGRLPVNLSSPTTYQEGLRTRSLISAILRINRGEELTEIKPDDYVAILPSMYTGSTDWTNTPNGKMQGGYIPVTLLNSVISGRWLLPIGSEIVWAIAFAILGLALAIVLPLRITLAAAGAILIGFFALSQFLFAYNEIMVPWLLPSLAMAFQVVLTFGERARWSEMQKGRLRQALEDTVPPERLEKLIQPGVIKREATEQVVTVVFIDMVGFSLQAERLTPQIAFRDLRQNIGKMTEIIHRHGGIIDKYLGDGLLCFFGYSFTGNSSIPGHADDALRCAIDVQRDWAQWTVGLSQAKRAIYPLRIGINTASAFIGDVGRGHIHFTLIGEGVNFAKRLEAACEPYKVMIGAATRDLLKEETIAPKAIHERPLQIKHHDDLFQSFEVNPFYDNETPLATAQDIIRRSLPNDRIAQRWPVPRGKLWVDFGIGSGEVTNYSISGLGFTSDVYPATGVKLTLNMEASDPELSQTLKSSGLIPLICEVRWGCPEEAGKRYRLGVVIRSLNALQLEMLNTILRSGLNATTDSEPRRDRAA